MGEIITVIVSGTVTAGTSVDLSSYIGGKEIKTLKAAKLGAGHAVAESGTAAYNILATSALSIVTTTPTTGQIKLDSDKTGVTLGDDLTVKDLLWINVEFEGEFLRSS